MKMVYLSERPSTAVRLRLLVISSDAAYLSLSLLPIHALESSTAGLGHLVYIGGEPHSGKTNIFIFSPCR